MVTRRSVRGSALLLTLLLVPAAATAMPPQSVWLEDLILHPSGPAEVRFGYDLQQSRLAGPTHRHAARISTAAGMDRAPIDFRPSVGVAQTGTGAARIDEVGLRLRFRLAGSPSNPAAVVSGGYRLSLADGVEHRPELGIAARTKLSYVSVAGWARLRGGLRNDLPDRYEATIGASLTGGDPLGFLHGGVEAFALIPLRGERLSEAVAGPRRRQVAAYVGPTLRLGLESMWLSGSWVTGRLRDTGANSMTRVLFGVQL